MQVDAAKQAHLLFQFGLSRSTAPAVVAFSGSKRRFAVHTGELTVASLGRFFDEVVSGKASTEQLRVSVPCSGLASKQLPLSYLDTLWTLDDCSLWAACQNSCMSVGYQCPYQVYVHQEAPQIVDGGEEVDEPAGEPPVIEEEFDLADILSEAIDEGAPGKSKADLIADIDAKLQASHAHYNLHHHLHMGRSRLEWYVMLGVSIDLTTQRVAGRRSAASQAILTSREQPDQEEAQEKAG